VIANANTGDQTQEVVSGSAGEFAFSVPTPGKYILAASGKGFQRQLFEQHEGYTSAIVVGPGKRSTGVIFRVQPDAMISGHVVDQFSEPVGDGAVYLFHDAVENGTHRIHLVRQTNLNDEGSFHFNHLPAGKFYVAVAAKPWFAQYATRAQTPPQQPDPAADAAQAASDELLDVAYPITFFGNTTDASASSPIITRAGETSVGDIALSAVPAVHATVNAGDSQPQAWVGLTQQLFNDIEVTIPTNTWTGGTNGRVALQGMAPGAYKISLQSYHPNDKTNGGGGTNDGSWTRTTRNVDLNGDTGEISFADTPARGATVTGRLVLETATAQPPADAMVFLTPPNGGGSLTTKVNVNGEFAFEEPVGAGNYEVFVSNLPRYVLRSLTATGASVSGRRITIGAEGKAVKLTISASRHVGTVNGTAVANDVPMAGAMIVLVPENPVQNAFAIRRDESDGDGTFTLGQIVPGRYTVLALRDGWEMEWNNPAVLKPYLPHGTPVVVGDNTKQDIKVEVQ
jgi:hypothetical protein